MTTLDKLLSGDRLRAAAERLSAATYHEEELRKEDGFERGLAWALDNAHPRELEAVASLRNEPVWAYRPEDGDSLYAELDELGMRELESDDPFSLGFVTGTAHVSEGIRELEG